MTKKEAVQVGLYLRGGQKNENLFFADDEYFVEENGNRVEIPREELRHGVKNPWDYLRFEFKENRVELWSIIYDGIELCLFGFDHSYQNDKNQMLSDLTLRIMDICRGCPVYDNED